MEIDLTKPHPGRMLDYWLGGHHYFEVDRQMCFQVEKAMPDLQENARRVRRFLGRMVNRMVVDFGHNILLDFGAGLPTCGNTHQVAQSLNPNIRVVYSDIDPLVVNYAHEILRDTPNVIYLCADATYPEQVLLSPEVQNLIGDERQVGIIYMNLAHFIPDGDLNRSMRVLWEWCSPGSHLFLSTMSSAVWRDESHLKNLKSTLESSGVTAYYRDLEALLAQVEPWQVAEDGIWPSVKWTWCGEDTPTLNSFYMFLKKG